MPGGILKKEWARQGQEVTLGARTGSEQPEGPNPPSQPPSAAQPQGSSAAQPRPAVRQLYQEQVKREALLAAEQIKTEAQQQAAALVTQASEAAEALKAKAELEAAQMREAAELAIAQREERLEQQVRAELAKEYQERYVKAMQALEAAAASIQKQQASYLEAIEQPAFDLVLAIARQVLGRELAEPARSLPGLIAHAFQLLQPQHPLKVHVSPLTFQQLSESELFADALARAGVRMERIELEIDSALGEGQFRAESGGSYIACDLPALLAELAGHLGDQARLYGNGEGTSA